MLIQKGLLQYETYKIIMADPFFFIRIGTHFKFKKDKRIYIKCSTKTYKEVNNESGVELFINSLTRNVTPTVYKDRRCIPRENIVYENVRPFALIHYNEVFKWLFSNTPYVKTGFYTYTGELTVHRGKIQTVEFTLLSSISTEMELIP